MPGKPNYSAAAFLNLIFIGTAFGSSGNNCAVAINATANALANFYISLHTADPTSTGGQNTSEVAYTGYARQAVARTTVGWTVTNANATAQPNTNITFPASIGGTGGVVTQFAIGDTLASNSKLRQPVTARLSRAA